MRILMNIWLLISAALNVGAAVIWLKAMIHADYSPLFLALACFNVLIASGLLAAWRRS